jgi:hypothetical protein
LQAITSKHAGHFHVLVITIIIAAGSRRRSRLAVFLSSLKYSPNLPIIRVSCNRDLVDKLESHPLVAG